MDAIALPAFPAGTKFGLVDGKPWSYVEAKAAITASDVGAFSWATGKPARESMSRFREDADPISEAEFRRAIAASQAGK